MRGQVEQPVTSSEIRERCIVDCWDTLAAYAWEQYQKEGRGAVVVSYSEILAAPAQPGGPPPLSLMWLSSHAAGEEAEFRIGARWPSSKEAEWVRLYDPASELVVIVIDDEGVVSSYRTGGPAGAPAPPDALRP
jgi:hypothetical protein